MLGCGSQCGQLCARWHQQRVDDGIPQDRALGFERRNRRFELFLLSRNWRSG